MDNLYKFKEFSTKPEENREKTMMRRIREMPTAMKRWGLAVVASLGPFVTSQGFHFTEYIRLQQAQEQVSNQIENYKENNKEVLDHIKRVRHEFGSTSEMVLQRMGLDIMELKEEKGDLEQREQFFYFPKSDLDYTKEEFLSEEAKDDLVKNQDNESEHEETVQFSSMKFSPTQELTGEDMRTIILRTFPKNWVTSEVAEITQANNTKKMPEEYGIEGDAYATHKDRGDHPGSIEFHRPSYEERPNQVFGVLGHELAHANDWETDDDLSSQEKLDLLLSVADRLDDKDRYASVYVESIENNDNDYEKYLKCKEYWAEICEKYFENPQGLNVEDYELVTKYVSKNDPDYDPLEQSRERLEMIINARDAQ